MLVGFSAPTTGKRYNVATTVGGKRFMLDAVFQDVADDLPHYDGVPELYVDALTKDDHPLPHEIGGRSYELALAMLLKGWRAFGVGVSGEINKSEILPVADAIVKARAGNIVFGLEGIYMPYLGNVISTPRELEAFLLGVRRVKYVARRKRITRSSDAVMSSAIPRYTGKRKQHV